MDEARRRRQVIGFQLAALGLSLLGLLLRCLPWRFVFGPDGRVVLPGVDPYYHLLRAEMIAGAFPLIPHFDPALSFPGGAPIPWPAGFDLLLALPALVFGRTDWIPTWAALLPPLLGALAIYLCALLGRRWFGAAAGLSAAGLLAIMHGALSFSFLGRADHHALVAPICLAMLLLATSCLETGSRRARWMSGLGVAALVFVSIGSWIVTPPLYFLPIFASGLWVLAWPGNEAGRREAVIALSLPSALAALLAVLATADLESQAWALFQNSWFVFLPFGAAALMTLLALRLPRTSFALCLSAGLAMLLLALFKPFDSLWAEAFDVLLGRHDSFSLIEESAPLYRHLGLFSMSWATRLYSHLVWLWPALVLGLFWLARLNRWRPALILAAIFVAWACLLLTLQQRFGEFAASALALALGWSLKRGADLLRRLHREQKGPRTWVLSAGLTLAALMALAPLPRSLWELAPLDPVSYQRALLDFASQVRSRLPTPARDAQGRPAWGLLVHWRDSHVLRWATGLPVSTSAFTTPAGLAGNVRAFRIWLEQDEERAFEALRAARFEYVLVSPALEVIQRMATAAGLMEVYAHNGHEPIAGKWTRRVQPMAPYARSLQARLMIADGSRVGIDGAWLEGLGHFQLLAESRAAAERFDRPISLFKLYRVVPGARILGRAQAGQAVDLRLDLTCPSGRRFTYHRHAIVDAQGAFSMIVPYANENDASAQGCRAEGPYRLRLGERIRQFRISEEMVAKGDTLSLESDETK